MPLTPLHPQRTLQLRQTLPLHQTLHSPFLSDTGHRPTRASTPATPGSFSASSVNSASASVISRESNSRTVASKAVNSYSFSKHETPSHPSTRSNTRRSRASGPTCSKSAIGKDGQSFVVALVEGRGIGAEIGMCFCNLKTSEVILCQVQELLRRSWRTFKAREFLLITLC